MNRCKNCGSRIFFIPNEKGNKCASCGSIFPIEYKYNFNKKPFSENVDLKVDNFAKNTKSLKCSSCGATMVLNKLQTQSNCPYCGNTSIVEGRKNKLMYIDSIIPFAFSKEDALKKFKTTLLSKFYVKKSVFNGVTEKNISGIYVNAFVFDMSVNATYSGVFSYTKTTKDKDGNTKYETVHKAVHGTYHKNFYNITVEANSNINQGDLHSIIPYNYNSAVDFKEDFTNGYILEYQDKMFNDCVTTAENIIESQIKSDLLRENGCDRIVRLSLNKTYLDRNYNYCLLPVYIVSNVYKDKKYTALVNGQNGKIGKLPTSAWRVLLTIFLVFGFIAGIILLCVFAG